MKRLKLLITAALFLALALANPASALHNSRISGYKWHDLNADGVWGADEPPLEGWTINLTGTDGFGRSVSLSTTTDASGFYEFFPLWSGNYTVGETLMPGWVQSYPAAPGTHAIALGAVEDVKAGNNFGNYQRVGAAVSGYKWHDLNFDGVWDEGEPPLSGWEICLTKTGEPPVCTTTNADGYYEFAGLTPGGYTISETLIPGWRQSFPPAPGTHDVSLETDEVSIDNNFGNWQSASLNGYKWHDLNADGVWDDGEPPLEGWVIECWNISGASPVFCCFTTTDADGYYEFEGLMPGVEYAVCELLVEEDGVYQGEPGYPIRLAGSWLQSYPTPGPDTIDALTIHADLGPVGRRIILTPGEVSEDNNFGNYQSGSISPGFTLTKDCAEEPVMFGDDAIFNIELANTGNVDLIVELDEDVVDTLGVIVTAGGTISAGVPFTLPVGQTLYATVAIEALTYPSVGNTINAVIKLPEWTGMSDSWTPTASDSCDLTMIAEVTACKEDSQGNPIAGWEILLSDGQTGYTDIEGCITFTVYEPGEYTIEEESRLGWTAIGPTEYEFIAEPGGSYGPYIFVNDMESILPDFTLTKVCVEEPLLEGNDAVFEIELANTGNVDLIVELDEDVVDTLGAIDGFDAGDTIPAGTEFTLPVGQTLLAIVVISQAAYPLESNTINAHITLPEWTGRDDSWDPTASDSCDVITMSMDKQISTSADGPWYDNLDPVPVGTPLYYRMVVTYYGLVDLEEVVVEDPTLGVTCNISDLQDGHSYTCGPYGPYPAQYSDGELCNTATATGTIADVSLFAEDTACYTTFNQCHSETAYGLNGALSPACFNTLGFDNWGWTHGPLAWDGEYTFDLWAGAAHCDTDKGTYAGTVTISYSGTGGYTILYVLEEGFDIVEEHVYIGRDQLPQVTKGKKTSSTVAPGQYYVTRGMNDGSIYIIYHAVVEWCD